MIQQLYISHIAGVPLKEARSAETNQETLGLIGSCHLTHSVSSRGQADKVKRSQVFIYRLRNKENQTKSPVVSRRKRSVS